MPDTYNCDYLKHCTFRFNLIDFQLNTDFPSQFCVFYREVGLWYFAKRNETKQIFKGLFIEKKIFFFLASTDSISKLCHVIQVINDDWKDNNDLFSSVLYISFSLGCYILQNYTKPSLSGFNMDVLECVYTIKTKFQPPGTVVLSLFLFVQWARFAFWYFAKRTNNFRRKIILEICLHHTLDNVKLTCTGRRPALRCLKFGCNEP